MELYTAPNLTPLTRQETLWLWMRRNNHTFVALAKHVGMTGNGMAKLLDQDTMPVRHHSALLGYGVPEALLPAPCDVKPGPKSKAINLRLDTPPDRRQRLKAWMAEHGVRQKTLAEALGIHVSYIGKIVSGEYRPAYQVARLIELGIPRQLLPEPYAGKPGPRPGMRRGRPQDSAAAS